MRFSLARPKEFYSGVIFLVIGLGTILKSRDYEMGTATQMGPGYFPTLLGMILVALGVLSAVKGLGPPAAERGEWLSLKPLLFITLGVFGFAALIARAGLVPAIFVLVLFACLPRLRSRPVEVLMIFLVLASGAVGIFIYGFAMPIEVIKLH